MKENIFFSKRESWPTWRRKVALPKQKFKVSRSQSGFKNTNWLITQPISVVYKLACPYQTATLVLKLPFLMNGNKVKKIGWGGGP